MAFAAYDNSIPTHTLLDNEVEVALDDENTGELKSQVNYRDGEIRRKGYSVAFRRLAETHGNLDPPKPDEDDELFPTSVDDGSLVVIKIIPRTESPQKRRFELFSITLSLELDGSLGGNQRPPSIIAYEPAADGDEYFQEFVTHVTNTTSFEASLGLQAPTAVEGTLGGTRSTERSFEQRRRLKLSSKSTGLHAGVDTEVTFDLTPASEEDGIGDSLAVALIVKRSPGTSFYIVAKTTARVTTRLKDIVPKMSSDHDLKNSLRLGPFGPASVAGEQKCPEGVDPKNLRLASDTLLKGLGYVHVAERGVEKLFVERKGNFARIMHHELKVPFSSMQLT